MGIFQKRKFNPKSEKQMFSGLFFGNILRHDHEYHICPYASELSGRSAVDDLAGNHRIFYFYAFDGAGLFFLHGSCYI